MLYKSIFYFLISLTLIVLLYIMGYYYLNSAKKSPSYQEEKNSIKPSVSEKKEKNFIENIIYTSTDTGGNKYQIESETGRFDEKDEELILMNNVKAYVLLRDNTKIFIVSKKAIYNNKTNDTVFSEDIKISHINHKIFCGELNFMFTKNLMSLKENIVYQNGYESFFADVMELDLLTKETKIFMKDETSKVKFLKNNGYN